MVTKAIITEIVDKYQVRVRIPIYDKADYSATATPDRELSIGPVSTQPGISPNFAVGDVVIVSFEEDIISKPIILGKLYTSANSNAVSDITSNMLTVCASAKLPKATTIGDVSASDIAKLKNISGNIQNQIDGLVTLSTAQIVTGSKTFTSQLKTTKGGSGGAAGVLVENSTATDTAVSLQSTVTGNGIDLFMHSNGKNRGLYLSGTGAGWLCYYDNTNFVIHKPIAMSSDVAASARKALGLTYESNDTSTFTNLLGSGYITSSSKSIIIGITVGKSLENISSISVNDCVGALRTASGGYVNGTSYDTNWLNQTGVTVTASKCDNYHINLSFASSSAYTNITNNTPVSMLASSLVLTFI